MDTTLALAALAALVYTFVNFVRVAKARDTNGVITMLLVWAAGIGALFLFAETSLAHDVVLGGIKFDGMGTWDKVLIGLIPGSFGIVGHDVLGAIDSTRTTTRPSLVTPRDTTAQHS